MDAAQVLQTVLSAIQAGAPGPMVEGTSELPLAAQADAPPMTLLQMILAVFSTAAFWDWAKLLLVGAFLELGRRGLAAAWEKLIDYVWVSASFDCDSDASDWLMYWMSQKKVFQTARSIEVGSCYFNLDNPGADDLGENADGEDLVAFFPSLARTYSLWYRGRYMTVTRTRVEGSVWNPKEVIEIRMLTRDPRLLRELLVEARSAYKAASEHLITIYVAESSPDNADEWKRVGTQVKRPTSSVVLDPGVLELVLDDAKDFLGSKKWYADRGIPFRRGYLLYGAPGAGKSSMIHSIAGELGLDIYILSLTANTMDDNTLRSLIAHLPTSCIVLMEDIDAALTRGMKREIADPERAAAEDADLSDGDDDDEPLPRPRPQTRTGTSMGRNRGKKGGRDAPFNAVTLSGLLNALDGIAAQEGRILFATTNDYSALDPALLRPGRLDLHVEFHLASEYQAKELFRRFYTSSSAAEADDDGDEKEEREKEADSGYASRSGSSASATPLLLQEEVKSVCVGTTHAMRAFHLSPKKAEALAERFAAAIPSRAFSMATLQGYLMAYKVRPEVAVEEAPAWVEKKMREKGVAREGVLQR